MRQLTIGKARGLQRLSNSKGIFAVCALDHRRSLRRMMTVDSASPITYHTIVEFKIELCEVLAAKASGVLLDPIYGATQAIAAGVLPGNVGLLTSLETGDDLNLSPEAEVDGLIDWNVNKVKAIGASGVKLPLYYRPDLPNIASEQLNTVIKSAYECKKADLALFLGPKNYAVRELERDSWEFARKKPQLVIDTVHQLSRLPVDVLKLEFPADMAYETDEKRLLDVCLRLTETSMVPWVLLSGGVSFDVFRRQIEIACRGGASGFLAGRALWQEAASMPPRARIKFVEGTALERLSELCQIADTYAKPWHEKLQICNNYLYPEIDRIADAVDEDGYGEDPLVPGQVSISDHLPR